MLNNLISDIRKAELVQGRSINLALSARGRKALAMVGLEEKLLEHGIPMHGRMLHDLKGRTHYVPYDPNTNQVCFHIFVFCFCLTLLYRSFSFESVKNGKHKSR